MTRLTSETISFFRQRFPVWWQRSLAIWGLWTIVALLSAAHWHFLFFQQDPWVEWDLIRVKLQLWYVWALVTPVILVLAHRFRIERHKVLSRSAVLVILSLLVTSAYVFAYAWILYVNMPAAPQGRYENLLKFTLSQHSTYYYLAFWVTVGIEHLLISYRRWHDREMQASQLQIQVTQAQLQAVKSQLQPHFLFNTLNTISSMILDGDRDKAYLITAKLGELLRIVLERRDQDLVTLDAEMSLNERYLELMAFRFDSRLKVQKQIAPDTLNALVPDFLLQPIIENAVKYGVGCTSGLSVISIRSRRQGDCILLEVEDTCDFPPASSSACSSSGQGHRLTEERLRCLYGTDYVFSASPTPRHGMLVHIELPLRFAPTEKAG